MPNRVLLTHRKARLLVSLAIGVAVSSCSDALTVCTSELIVDVSPRTATIAVGDTVSPQIRMTSCSGREVLPVRASLASPDTAIVRVAEGRRLIATGVGNVAVALSDSSYGNLGPITLTVIPAP